VSVLIVGAEGALGEAVIARLVSEGDDVRVIEPESRAADRWKALGAHVARGTPDDVDLVERAAQNVRTLVALRPVAIEPIVAGAVAARVGRLVLCADRDVVARLEAADVEFVVLVVPRRRFARRAAVTPGAVAEAVDAADDMPGTPRIVVNLSRPDGWHELGLAAPPS
jgi:Trk K+ transport system NAD-binding subunit